MIKKIRFPKKPPIQGMKADPKDMISKPIKYSPYTSLPRITLVKNKLLNID